MSYRKIAKETFFLQLVLLEINVKYYALVDSDCLSLLHFYSRHTNLYQSIFIVALILVMRGVFRFLSGLLDQQID